MAGIQNLNRRGILGVMAAAPAVVVMPARSYASSVMPSGDPQWPKLVADFRAKYTAWLTTIDREQEADNAFAEASVSLPPKPEAPGAANKGNILDKTLRELRDACDTPEHTAAHAAYERDNAAWKAQRDALRDQIVGPAKAAYEEAFAIRSNALNTLMAYRVTNLADLGEKIEIIRDDHDGCDIPREYVADILADVRHLARES
jgi:hypothetical protein